MTQHVVGTLTSGKEADILLKADLFRAWPSTVVE
jgi:hypothetical protein